MDVRKWGSPYDSNELTSIKKSPSSRARITDCITYELNCLCYKCFNHYALYPSFSSPSRLHPTYLIQQLTIKLHIPTPYSAGQYTFTSAGTHDWNTLSSPLCQDTSLTSLKWQLKTRFKWFTATNSAAAWTVSRDQRDIQVF